MPGRIFFCFGQGGHGEGAFKWSLKLKQWMRNEKCYQMRDLENLQLIISLKKNTWVT